MILISRKSARLTVKKATPKFLVRFCANFVYCFLKSPVSDFVLSRYSDTEYLDTRGNQKTSKGTAKIKF